jgi:putative peptide zinc metalloprotease protein
MATAQVATSALYRRLALRARRDLALTLQSFRGQPVWALKDPVALQYFHLKEEEFWIFRQLDGTVSLSDVRERFMERFAPRRLALSELQSFLGTLHQAGLVISDAPGQGEKLLRHAREQRIRQLWQTLANPLAIRLRGFDPDWLLSKLLPFARFCFTDWGRAGAIGLILSAVILIAARFDVLQARIPEMEVFFGPANLAWIAATLAGIKVLHELGHGLTLKHFGGECHEMGIMLLVLTPCLYCNVSDAWMLKDKWQRAAVGGAGIAVELVLAASCTFLWWFSEPGLFNSLCLDVMFVCSVNTLLINGNPLLRYDGYYVLADLLEMPNLSRQATMALRVVLARAILGVELPEEDNLPAIQRSFLAGYALTSLVYRWIILFGVLWFVHKTLQPYRMEIVAELLAAAVVAGLALKPLLHFGRFLSHPFWSRKVQSRRALVSGLAVLAVAAALLAVPLPHRVTAPVLVQSAGARRIYAAVGGRLTQGVLEGSAISTGDTLATLENTDLALEIKKLRGQRDQQRLRVRNLRRRQVQDDAAAAELPSAEEFLADLEGRLTRKEVDERRLILRSPIGGTVLPPPRRELERPVSSLSTWSGTPLEPHNRGCHLETGTLVCLVGDTNALEAILIIDQSEIEFVAPGQKVRIQLDQDPGEILTGVISELSEVELEVTPRELIAAGNIATRADDHGRPRPVSTSYQARVELDAQASSPLIGESGRARIEVAPLSLGRRLVRLLGRTFRMELLVL